MLQAQEVTKNLCECTLLIGVYLAKANGHICVFLNRIFLLLKSIKSGFCILFLSHPHSHLGLHALVIDPKTSFFSSCRWKNASGAGSYKRYVRMQFVLIGVYGHIYVFFKQNFSLAEINQIGVLYFWQICKKARHKRNAVFLRSGWPPPPLPYGQLYVIFFAGRLTW